MKANIPSKKKLPKSYMRLPEYEKQAINKAMQELYDEALDREEIELQKIWIQLACIVLNESFNFTESELTIFLGNWKRAYRKNAKCKTKAEQEAFLKAEMDRIFGENKYPYEWVDKLEEIG